MIKLVISSLNLMDSHNKTGDITSYDQAEKTNLLKFVIRIIERKIPLFSKIKRVANHRTKPPLCSTSAFAPFALIAQKETQDL